jgi:predicted dehydrogenase
MAPTKIGIIGCGDISPNYLNHLKMFGIVEVAACADLVAERAEKGAKEFGVPRACSVKELLDDPSIEIVANLTIPKAHFDVAMQVVAAGKHVYNEKPLTIGLDDARRLLAAAKAKGVRVGCAPDTFLGAGIQTCRKLIADGAIGEPIAATAFMMCHGHESWHPAPTFYYQKGGGPMFDMGPYYLTALTALIGPMRRVAGMARVTFPTRTITSQPLNGTVINVEVPTHVAGLIEFAPGASGAIAVGTIITSFDVWAATLPPIEIHGTRGSLGVPDPNGFGGPVRVRLAGEGEWRDVPLTHPYAEGGRGIGIADMAYALRSGRPHRASGELAAHVLEAMHAFHTASDQGRTVELTMPCTQPAPLPIGLRQGELDE